MNDAMREIGWVAITLLALVRRDVTADMARAAENNRRRTAEVVQRGLDAPDDGELRRLRAIEAAAQALAAVKRGDDTLAEFEAFNALEAALR